jgi:hypothetical protein
MGPLKFRANLRVRGGSCKGNKRSSNKDAVFLQLLVLLCHWRNAMRSAITEYN